MMHRTICEYPAVGLAGRTGLHADMPIIRTNTFNCCLHLSFRTFQQLKIDIVPTNERARYPATNVVAPCVQQYAAQTGYVLAERLRAIGDLDEIRDNVSPIKPYTLRCGREPAQINGIMLNTMLATIKSIGRAAPEGTNATPLAGFIFRRWYR